MTVPATWAHVCAYGARDRAPGVAGPGCSCGFDLDVVLAGGQPKFSVPRGTVDAHDRGYLMAPAPPDAGLSQALRAQCSDLVATMYADFGRAGFPDAAQSLFDAIGETEELVDHYARRGLDGSDLLDAVAELSGRLADEREDEEPESLARTRTAIRAALGRLEQAIDPEAKGRRGFYVYVHKDAQGRIFYVGKGTRGRAWSRDRHSLWHK